MVSTGHKYKQGDVFANGICAGDIKVFIREARDLRGKKRPITVRSWSTIKDVKDQLQLLLHVPPSVQRLFVVGPLHVHGRELPNHRTLQDAGIYKSGETLLLDIRGGADGVSGGAAAGALLSSGCSSASGYRSGNEVSHDGNTVHITQFMLDCSPRALKKTVHQALKGFVHGYKPELVLEGSGGTYLLHGQGKARVGVFKPADEEPYAENNPRGYVRTTFEKPSGSDECGTASSGENLSLRAGIVPGEACVREVAAFLLDHDNFSSVPNTTLVEARHPAFNTNGSRLKLSEGGASIGTHSVFQNTVDGFSNMSESVHKKHQQHADIRNKIGSFQEFIHAECSMDDLSPSKLSVDEVHKIAILDIRVMNADRNSANLLCVRRRNESGSSNYRLVPIDHGYCLRTVCDVSWFDWCWLDWPQLKKPLSKKSRDYILNLDIEADVAMLRKKLLIDDRALDIFRASSKLLQAGVRSGLRLYDIALACCRHDDAGEIPSRLELLNSHALELATSAMQNGKWHHTAALRALTEQLVPEPLMIGRSQSVYDFGKSSVLKTPSGELSFAKDEKKSFNKLITDSTSLPQITHLSSSDSSSDAGEVPDHEQEECNVWAASLVADVSMELNGSLSYRKRSHSVTSDNSFCSDSSDLSGSQQGFWHIRPGSAQNKTENSEWSPSVSPRSSHNFDEDSQSPSESVATSAQVIPDSLRSNTLVRFADDEKFSDGQMNDLSPNCQSPAIVTLSKQSSESDGIRGLVRSQSFSVLHSSSFGKMDKQMLSVNSSRTFNVGSERELHREYAVKFVDLLIERETVAAARLKKQNYVSL